MTRSTKPHYRLRCQVINGELLWMVDPWPGYLCQWIRSPKVAPRWAKRWRSGV